jgi:hypothetical protein
MQIAIKAMVGLAGLAFVLAVICSAILSGPILGIPAEGFSRACTNLALLAIASSVCLDGKAGGSESP